VAVTGETQAGTFHHLEGAGRKHIAVSNDTVAVTWEDDSSGDPQVYVSIKTSQNASFSEPLRISAGSEAYEPSIAALDKTRFIVAWEQDGLIYARMLVKRQPGETIRLSELPGGHTSLAILHDEIYCVWREQRDNKWNLVVARLEAANSGLLTVASHSLVEANDNITPILFPSISVNTTGIYLAWEDRKAGHTRLKYSYSSDRGKTFTSPQYLNEFQSNRNEYDKGSGVTRVSLAAYGEDEIVAAWMDKRRSNTGYGIFAAFGSEDAFGPNEKVHGSKGDLQPHYNPATSGNQDGVFIVAWDDFRNGHSDIWISSYNDDGEWSKDFAPPPASGKGEQTHASVALDQQGNLHLVWIERESVDTATRLWYSLGKRD